MNYKFLFLWTGLLLAAGLQGTFAQQLEEDIEKLRIAADSADSYKKKIAADIENLKLAAIQRDLQAIGLPKPLPGNEIVMHSAMALEYSEAHEQARWVAHIITPDVLSGTVFRSNDFRPDPKINTGSAVEADYFLKFLQPDSTYTYDGFGYDRGHLAPSADFRWSATALSESYLYSNMSPQVPAFNRESWATVEDRVRGYLNVHPNSRLYVVTGPLLHEKLSRMERGVHKVAIPEFYWKIALDPIENKGIGFIMPNRAMVEPVEQFAVSIDSVERLTGIRFFETLPPEKQQAKQQRQLEDWFPNIRKGDVEPVAIQLLQKGQINTSIARDWINQPKPIEVVGRVVGARLSRAGNVLLNLDKQFPNQVFTVFIRKENLPNFPYDPVAFFSGKQVAVKQRITGLDGLPAMFLENDSQIRLLN